MRKHPHPPGRKSNTEAVKQFQGKENDEKRVHYRTLLYEFASATNGFAAGLQLSSFQPDLLIQDLGVRFRNQQLLGRWLHAFPPIRVDTCYPSQAMI